MSAANYFRLIAQAGGGACTAGVSTLTTITDTTSSGTPARTGAKWDSDGDVYRRVNTTVFTQWNSESWIGSCANTEYEGRWNLISGDAPSTSTNTDGTWHEMTTDVMVGYDTPADDFIYSGSFTFEVRRKSDSVIIITDAFTMYAEEAPA